MAGARQTHLVLVDAGRPRHGAPALFEAMLSGWRTQQSARCVSTGVIESRERTVRRFLEYAASWPWEWREEQIESWVAQAGWAHSTVRTYEGDISRFLDFVCDPRYGWPETCAEQLGRSPRQICHDDNRARHVADYEGRPGRRAFTRTELQALFDTADRAVADAATSPRKGYLAAFRDATLLKLTYGWGLRRREVAMLDVTDFSANPAVPSFGTLGVCQVRYGKAMRYSAARRRSVISLMPWAVAALQQYLDDVRPLHGEAALGPALWLTERGERISSRRIDERFSDWRALAGLPRELSVHSLRHAYASHLTEDGVDPLFIQHQLGHSFASTTAGYSHISDDHTRVMVAAALEKAFPAEEDR